MPGNGAMDRAAWNAAGAGGSIRIDAGFTESGEQQPSGGAAERIAGIADLGVGERSEGLYPGGGFRAGNCHARTAFPAVSAGRRRNRTGSVRFAGSDKELWRRIAIRAFRNRFALLDRIAGGLEWKHTWTEIRLK